jgi:hypothetical protein
MDRISKSPFSLYDFLGYFIPGALFCYLIAIAFKLDSYVWLNIDFFRGLGLFDQSIAFVIVAYVLGHALNHLSTLTIERYSIWSIGYPSKYILGIKQKSYFKKLKDKNDKDEEKRRKKELCISKVWRISLLIVISPMFIFDFLIGKIAGFRRNYTNSIDTTLKNIIVKRIEKFSNKYGYNIDGDGDYFRIIWHYYYEKFNVHAVKLDKYVALYGFTRAVSFVFCIFCWIITLSLIVHSSPWYYYLITLPASGFLSYIFYIAFVKFYRRFTLEGFMCLVIDEELEKRD